MRNDFRPLTPAMLSRSWLPERQAGPYGEAVSVALAVKQLLEVITVKVQLKYG